MRSTRGRRVGRRPLHDRLRPDPLRLLEGVEALRGPAVEDVAPVPADVARRPAVERDGDWFGATVNLAARVSAEATGGEVLLTGHTAALAPTLDGVLYEPRGRFQLNVEHMRRAGLGPLYERFLKLKAKLEADPAKRHDMYVKMQDLMEESGDYVFLTHEAVGVLYRNTVVAATMPNGTPIFHKFAAA